MALAPALTVGSRQFVRAGGVSKSARYLRHRHTVRPVLRTRSIV
jgi:hypothetical protein